MTNSSDQRIKRLAWFLDSSIRLPGGFRIGVESIVGLVPGVGDAIGALASSYIILEAAKIGTPKRTLLKMIKNALLEAVVGTVPIAGDIFDMAYKANMRNYKLLENHMKESTLKPPRSNKKVIAYILILLGIVLLMLIWISFQILKLAVSLF